MNTKTIEPLIILVFGVKSDLSQKKIFPALYNLYKRKLLPPYFKIVGLGRKPTTHEDFLKHITRSISTVSDPFFLNCTYMVASPSLVSDMEQINKYLVDIEKQMCQEIINVSQTDNFQVCTSITSLQCNRLAYLALPSSLYVDICYAMKGIINTNNGWFRVVLEKPFGKDGKSCMDLMNKTLSSLPEKSMFRIDHYLGKEMIKNIYTLRFSNPIFSSIWNNKHIANISITFKETLTVNGRCEYFDAYGIIRDVIQNHLTQILCLISMEQPQCFSAESMREEKVRLLKAVEPVKPDETVLGQYISNTAPDGVHKAGYLEDPQVHPGSKTPTFASLILHINNERWCGVPFFIKAGKALDKQNVTVRIQFKGVDCTLDEKYRNELIIRIQPDESIFLKIITKDPETGTITQKSLDFSYHSSFQSVRLPEAYESLISAVISGDATDFVSAEELLYSWEIFTPLLEYLEKNNVVPYNYKFGSRGPKESDDLFRKYGLIK